MGTITLGYSDSEDRLWARIVDSDSNEARFWLTRRLVERLIDAVANILEKTLPVVNVPVPMVATQRLALEASIATETPVHAPPPLPLADTSHVIADSGLCGSVNIRSKDTYWVLTWQCEKNKSFVTNLNRAELHSLLKALLSRQHNCGWKISAPAWISQYESEKA